MQLDPAPPASPPPPPRPPSKPPSPPPPPEEVYACLDDPTFQDVWACRDWIGLACWRGYPPVNTPERIYNLVKLPAELSRRRAALRPEAAATAALAATPTTRDTTRATDRPFASSTITAAVTTATASAADEQRHDLAMASGLSHPNHTLADNFVRQTHCCACRSASSANAIRPCLPRAIQISCSATTWRQRVHLEVTMSLMARLMSLIGIGS